MKQKYFRFKGLSTPATLANGLPSLAPRLALRKRKQRMLGKAKTRKTSRKINFSKGFDKIPDSFEKFLQYYYLSIYAKSWTSAKFLVTLVTGNFSGNFPSGNNSGNISGNKSRNNSGNIST